jgi:ABC-type dipeptide/oligopeptide/nickel transport system permease subunit
VQRAERTLRAEAEPATAMAISRTRRQSDDDHPRPDPRASHARPPPGSLSFAATLVPQRRARGRDRDRRRAHPWSGLRPLADPYSPVAQNLEESLQGPSAAHWLGTDQFGRDALTRLIWSTRVDLRIGFLAVLIPFVVGSILGGLAGYFGGWLDVVVMRLSTSS